ncbi:Hypp8402 [Branchiostoma lanceolatum]|uniref:Hypp8402 protein n=1 Tax=Branchiostoma lanceolatum TaxID=7740 RepID=A0A8J9Z819_BRALA|nr:Hypp8402 [Branchiostoma lanceolatum]
MKSERVGVPNLKNEGTLISDNKAKADLLNQQFQSVFTTEPLEDPLPDMGPSPHTPMMDIKIDTTGINKLLDNLNPHKACGPDHVHACVLKELSTTLSPFLQAIFQKSLDTGCVPEAWKEANIAPVYKKGNRLDPANYRPISLTCICSKIMEHIIASSMMTHFDSNNILYDLQHGFRNSRSCESKLLSLTDDLAHNREKGIQTDLIIMDFAKAFDKVPHLRLIHKLQFFGITGKTLVWIQNFLQGRSQTVVLDGECSDSVPVTSGVPQGTVLGPILFLAYINDLPQHAAHAKVRLFADDCILQMSVKEKADCEKLQSDINEICSWEKKWLMAFNPSKCEVMSVPASRIPIIFPYTLHDHPLAKVSCTKYLGLHISSNLTWGKHVEATTSKANRTLGMLRRCLRISSTAAKERAYMALVRPVLEYGCCVWDPHTREQVRSVEMVQRRAARYVSNDYRRTSSVTAMLRNLGWQTLELRRKIARQVTLYKIIHGTVYVPHTTMIAPVARCSRRTNHSQTLQAIACRNNYYRLSFFPRTIKEWNELEPGVAEAGSLSQFKTELGKTLLH